MNPFLLFVFCILFGFEGFSQSSLPLKGRIVNRAGDGIHKASIVILNTGLGTISDTAGNFIVPSLYPGKYQLQISAMGYASAYKETDLNIDTAAPVIILSPSYAQLDEVIVSAEKTEERLQCLPSTVSSISSRQVSELRLWNISNITAIVPNLYSANSGDNRNVTSIRGIGTTSYEQAVATYVDGVNQFSLDTYIPNLFDIDRIEVLRGPQGTLYGRNAMGGVINIITKKPSNHTQVYGEINVGNNGLLRLSMAVKMPLIKDKLFFGAAALYEQRNGYYTNVYNGKDFDHQKNFNGNYYLKYLPSQRLEVTLNAKHLNNQNEGPFPLATDKTTAFEEPFTVNQNAVTTMKDDNINASLSIQYRADKFRFSSQTAYQSNYRIYQNPIDGDFSPLDAITVINDYGKDYNKVKVWTQEFRFTSPTNASDKFKWTAGTFLFAQDNPVKQGTGFGADALLLGIPDTNFTLINTNLAKNKGVALFGQFSYTLSNKLSLIAGLRYDLENRELAISGEYYKAPDPAFPIVSDTSASDNFDAFSPKVGLQYQIAEDQTLYINYSRGYRAGGFTSLTSDPSQPPLYTYHPESSNNIELGWKNYFWDKRLTLNAAIFYSFVNNAQVPTLVLPDAITVVSNSGELTTKGAEIEISARAFKGLELFYSAGITDAKYGSLSIPVNGSIEKMDGNRQIFTPAYTSFLTGQYTYVPAKNPRLRVLGRIEWMVLGKQYFDLANSISQEAYGLLNARAGIEIKHIGLFAWARNLGDKKYISYAYDFGGIHLGDPRTYGGTVSFTF